MRAPFRYWGSKVRMAPWIIERLPDHNHFVEACAGSAAVMAIKPPVDAETLNDTYGEVVNFFRVLRDPVTAADLIDKVAFTPYSLAEFIAAGEIIEGDYADPVVRAWAFFIRMQMAVVPGRTGWSYGVGGASTKKANKPGRWSTMPELLKLASARFDRVQVTDWDILDLIERLDAPGVLLLVDPPYLDESRPKSLGTSSAYVKDAFDHDAFIKAMHAAKHASFAITHYPHPLYDGAGLTVAGDYSSHRNIPNGDGRDVKAERLYLLDRSTSALRLAV
jgi:DNA adenine methylase